MRVRVIASRISAMIADRRSNAASTGTSVGASRSRRASSLRASTMSDTPLIIRSSSSTGQADGARRGRGLAVSAPRLRQRSAPRGSSAPGASAAISALSSPAGNSSPASIASTISPIRSMIASTALTSAASARGVPARTSASTSSAAWLRRSSRGRSKKPQLPFTVWTKRKMLSSRARSSGCGLPRDDLAAQGFEHLAGFGDEFGKQIVHRLGSPQRCNAIGLRGEELRLRYPCREGRGLGGGSLPRDRGADQQHRARSVRNLDRSAALRHQAVGKPGAAARGVNASRRFRRASAFRAAPGRARSAALRRGRRSRPRRRGSRRRCRAARRAPARRRRSARG